MSFHYILYHSNDGRHPSAELQITTTTRHRPHCWLLDSWQVSFLITRAFIFICNSCGAANVWDDEDDAVQILFWFLAKKNIHDSDPHNCCTPLRPIQFDVGLFDSVRMQLGALWAHAISVHVRCRTRISCSMVIYGCFFAVFLFGFNCFLMIRSGIRMPYGLCAQFC